MRSWLTFFRAAQKEQVSPAGVLEDLVSLGTTFSNTYLPNIITSTFPPFFCFFAAFAHRLSAASSKTKPIRPLLLLPGLPEDNSKFIAKAYKKNFVALSRAVVSRTLTVNQLTDMQWRFGVTSGSSEERKSGKTFLQMMMTLNDGVKSEDVFTGPPPQRRVLAG